MGKTFDGLEMTRILPAFNQWHDLDLGSGAGMAVDAKAAAQMISALNEMMIPSAPLEDALAACISSGAPFPGAKSETVKDYNSQMVQLGKLAGAKSATIRSYEKAAANCVAPVPPIKFCLRRDTSWANAAFRTGSSCWWSSQFKTNWTPGEDGFRTGFAILFAMDRSRVKRGSLSSWESAIARGGRDLYPENWGPLGRSWVYPAPGGFYVFNTYDDFRDSRSALNDQTVASMIAGILNKALGKEVFTGGYREGSSTPFSVVHMNSNRCGEVWAIDGERPFSLANKRSSSRIQAWESVSWWTIGDRRRGITTAPMIYSFRYSSKQFGCTADMFTPLFPGKRYIVDGPIRADRINLIDPDIEVVRGKMYGVNVLPVDAVRLDSEGNIDVSMTPVTALAETGRLTNAIKRFLDKLKKIGGLKLPIGRGLEANLAETMFTRRLPDQVFFGAANDIVCGGTPDPTPENVLNRLELFCLVCQAAYEATDEELRDFNEEKARLEKAAAKVTAKATRPKTNATKAKKSRAKKTKKAAA